MKNSKNEKTKKRNNSSGKSGAFHSQRKGKATKSAKAAKSAKTRRRSAKTPIFSGEFFASGKGYGFVSAQNVPQQDRDIFIKSDNIGNALDGDTVKFRILPKTAANSGSERVEGVIVDVIERAAGTFIGTLFKIRQSGGRIKDYWCVIPDSPKLKIEPRVIAPENAQEGDKVEVKITNYGSEKTPPTADITKIFGNSLSREANYAAILHENEIVEAFEDIVLSQAQTAAKEEISAAGRKDFRDKTIFTMDGADAKDLDDAVSIETLPDGSVNLGVHIADVSHYVKEYTPLDYEALRRGTSVYFADKAIPMLPAVLSNGACSLNSGEDRYTLSAIITIDKSGKISDCKLYNAIIRTSARGVYSELNDLLQSGESSRFYDKYKHIYSSLLEMTKLFSKLEENAKARGVLELDSTEAKILLGEDGAPVDIIKRTRGITERMIEQFMLCANEAVASYLHSRRLPCVYRIHENPSPDKIQSFSLFAHNLGLDITPLRKGQQKNLSSKAFQPLLLEAETLGIGSVLSKVLLRSLMKAKYSSIHSAHFGLALDIYCHFTSPIRRYPDLSVHRILKYAMRGQKDTKARYSAFAALSAKMSTENEIRAITAERAIDDLYKVIYMSSFVGQTFDAAISSVTSFGIFAELDNTCEGLIPLSALDGFFTYDEKSLTLSAGSVIYRLGDKVRVKIENADIVRRRVEMSIIQQI